MIPFPRKPIEREQELRYLRRLANRRVRKVRRARNVLRFSGLVLLNIVIIATLVWAVARGLSTMMESKTFFVERIEIEGAGRSSAERIHGELKFLVGRSLFDLDLLEIERVTRRDPWVAGSSVERILPDTVRVRLHERTPCALAVIEGVAHLVDDTGYVLGPTAAERADDLPVLTGLEALEPGELAARLRRGVGILERLRRESLAFAEEISELDLRRADRITVRTVSPGPELLLDPQRVERNVLRYLSLRPRIGRRLGDVAYVDLRWSGRIAVMPLLDSS